MKMGTRGPHFHGVPKNVMTPVWKGGPTSGSDFFVEFRSVIRVRYVYSLYHLFILESDWRAVFSARAIQRIAVAFEHRVLRGLSRKY